MKTFLKDEQIQRGTLKKGLKIIGRKLILILIKYNLY